MDFVTNITGIIVEKLVAPISRQIGYLLCYKCNIDDFRREHQNLRNVRDSVQLRVNEATNNCEIILPYVDAFLTNVDTFTEHTVKLFDEQEVTKEYCCFTGNYLNLKLRHKLSRKATKSKIGVDKMIEEGKTILTFHSVSSHAPVPKNTSTSTRDGEEFESRKLIFEEIMGAIKDNQLKIIGIYGMGGVGKTTLIKQVARKAKADNLFDDVAMAVVSQNPDLRAIQSRLAEKLGVHFNEESLEGRAERLLERLKKRSLVILDDIWGNLKLEDIGIPFDCKVVLTSRSRDVCSQMGTQKNILIKVLNELEAWNLFQKMATGDLEPLPPLAVEVAKECAGLPIAIVTVARALKGKSLSVWRDTLTRQRKSSPDDSVFENIKMSYDFLKSEAKSFFLLCCLFPEDFKIPLECLLGYAMGLGLFKGVDTLEEARDRAHTLADVLKYSCLLQEEDGRHVKMHDVIRDVAISIASEGEHIFLVRAGEQWKEWPREHRFEQPYTAISIMSNSICKLPDWLECPKLQLLQLECSHPSLHFPENFFSTITDLKVLTMSNMEFSSLPPSLRHLKKLRTLFVYQCINLKDISIIGELERLEYLSFAESGITELPVSIGRLTRLRLLDLRGCGYGLSMFRPDVISLLSNLEGLYTSAWDMFVELSDFEGLHTAETAHKKIRDRLAELTQLSLLTTLELSIRNADVLPKEDLLLNKLLRYHICVGQRIFGYEMQNFLRTLKLKKTSTPLNNGIMGLLKGVEKLELSEMDVSSVLHELDISEGFPNLKSLTVYNCSEVEYIFNATNFFSRFGTFPVLQELNLYELPNLKEICHGQLPIGFFSELQVLVLEDLPELKNMWKEPSPHVRFPKLRDVTVANCPGLKTLFPHPIAKDLPELVNLTVRKCKLMREVGGSETEEAAAIEDNIEFPQLHELVLFKLPNLDSFCSKIKVSFPNLEDLHIRDTKLKQIIWRPNTLFYKNLRSVFISGCHSLTHVFSPSVARGLVQLQILTLENCHMMEEIIMEEREGEVEENFLKPEEGVVVELSQLRTLGLWRLPKLTNVWPQGALGFPNLIALDIYKCNSLRSLFSPSIASILVQLQVVKIVSCRMMEAIIVEENGEETMTKNNIVFPRLHTLVLDYLQNLVGFYNSGIPHPQNPDTGDKVSRAATQQGISIQPLFGNMVAFPNLELLHIEGVENLQEIFHSRVPHESFHQLKKLEVIGCYRMVRVAKSNILPRLKNLRKLEVEKCNSMVEIFGCEGPDAEGNAATSFLQLEQVEYIRLNSLPKLKIFCSGNQNLQFSSLKNLCVELCPLMEKFSSGIISTPRLSKVHRPSGDQSWPEEIWKGDLNSTIQYLFNSMVHEPYFEINRGIVERGK